MFVFNDVVFKAEEQKRLRHELLEQEERLAAELERRKTEKLRLEKLRQQIRDNRFVRA